MSGETNITGRWAGNYFQRGRPQPIVAIVVQTGDRLTGSMKDGVTEPGRKPRR